MVYGLNVKPEWGFDPKVDPLDGDLSKVKTIDPFDGHPAGWGGRLNGVRVDSTHFPTRVSWTEPNGNPVPDFDNSRALNVSETARAVIESVEPDVHQFFPVEFVDSKDRHIEHRFWMVICNRIDSLDREHTTMVLRKGKVWRPAEHMARRGEPIPSHIDPKLPSKMVFSLKSIGNRHIWMDKHLDGGGWLSDIMAAAFRTAGLTGVRFSENGMEQV